MKLSLKHILFETARYLLALTLIFSGVVKAIDPVGSGIKVGEYLTAFHLTFFVPYALVIAILLSSMEFLLGACLFMGLWRKFLGWISVGFMSFMTTLTLYLALYNPVSDCGCFGDAFKLTNWQTFEKNIVLLSATIIYLIGYRYTHRAFASKKMQFFGGLLALSSILVFTMANYFHLPVLDFRPYKVGESLPSLVLIPDDAPQDEYTYEFVYEKEGVQKTFDIDHLPDSTWNYIERKEKLISKGYIPPVTDFVLFNGTEDVTHNILSIAGDMIFVVTPSWAKVSTKYGDRLNQLYALSEQKGITLFALSGSSTEEEDSWKQETLASYPTLFLDATTIKTIARGVPSILFLKDGVIIRKINAYDLPEQTESIDKYIDQTYNQGVRKEGYLLRSILLVVWFILTSVFLVIRSTSREPIGVSLVNGTQD